MNTASTPNILRNAWEELRRRKVVGAAGTYAVVAWVVLQLAEITFEPLGLPARALTWTILAAILGFPVVLVLAWFFDVGPQGVVRDRSRAARAGRFSAVLLVLLTVLAVAFWLDRHYADAPLSGGGAPANTVAVLPFDDMSPQRDQSHLADGIAEELLDRLARNRQIRVASRTSSFALRGRAADIREIGRLLQVRWVLEGSVRKDGRRLRITAQLIDAGDGYHVWSETYDRDDGDLFALQDEVSGAIVDELSQRMGGGGVPLQATADKSAESTSPAAHEAYLRARQLWRQRTPAALRQAEALFREAVQRDPRFARAWAGLADTWLLEVDYGGRPAAEAVQLAEPAAVRAVSLAPDLGEVWATLGLMSMRAGQLDAAQRSLEKAIRLDPRYEMAPMWLASVLADKGDLAGQEQVLRRARELNPLEPVIVSNLASLLGVRGQVAEAETMLRQVLAITPDNALLLRSLATLDGSRGELAAALRSARAAHATDPKAPANIDALAGALIGLGECAAANAAMAVLAASGAQGLVRRQSVALCQQPPTWLDGARERVAELQAGDSALGPEAEQVLLVSAWTLLAQQKDSEALALLRRLCSAYPDAAEGLGLRQLHQLGLLAALDPALAARHAADWRRASAGWEQAAGSSATGALEAAAFAALAGEQGRALDLLEVAARAGLSDRFRLQTDPRLRSLRESPRFQAVQQAVARRLAQQRHLAGLERG